MEYIRTRRCFGIHKVRVVFGRKFILVPAAKSAGDGGRVAICRELYNISAQSAQWPQGGRCSTARTWCRRVIWGWHVCGFVFVSRRKRYGSYAVPDFAWCSVYIWRTASLSSSSLSVDRR